MKKYSLFLVVITFTLFSCKKNENNIDFGFDYFPLEEGHFVEYDVQLIFHDVDLSPQHDTIHYRLKTVIGEDYIDNLDRTAKKLFRYSYDINSGELLDQRVWTTLIDENKRGEVIEENQRKIRLVFAVNEEKEWDVNAYNSEGEEIVHYSEINVPKTVNEIDFDETATVFYDDFLSLVDYRKMHETYAKGVGLIERSFKDLTISNFDTTQIKKGTEVHYKIVNYGKE